jgi:hypothetical protein
MNKPPYAIHGRTMDRVSADDRAWFKRNPGCGFRLRELAKFEFNGLPLGDPGDGFRWFVLVAHIEPGGLRLKTPVSLLKEQKIADVSQETLLWLWKKVSTSKKGRRTASGILKRLADK